jgi:2-aminoethylphosphonate-pyruvate transaminase
MLKKTMKTRTSTRHHLFCPGPVNVADNVKQAVIAHEIGHREQEFSDLMRDLNKKLLKVYEIRNTRKYYPVFVTGSGTAANETVLSSVVGEKHILVLVNGEFGERLYGISKIHNPNTTILHFGWGEKIDVKAVETYLKNNKVDIIAMVHHETSSGMINPVVKVGRLAKKHKALYFVDTVSSAGADKIEIEKANITFCTSSASKALGSLPGLSFVIGVRKEIEKTKDLPVRIAYLNLYKFYHYSSTKLQTPNTPAVQLFFALEQALTNILKEGVAVRRRKLKKLATSLRTGMEELGLSFLIDKKDMSSVLTTVLLPAYTNVEDLKAKLKEKNIIIYNGKGPFENKVFQVSNIGQFCSEEVKYFLSCLKDCLDHSKLTQFKHTALPPKRTTRNTVSKFPSPTAFPAPIFPQPALHAVKSKVV